MSGLTEKATPVAKNTGGRQYDAKKNLEHLEHHGASLWFLIFTLYDINSSDYLPVRPGKKIAKHIHSTLTIFKA
jgi:hypothetical protein